VRLWISSTSHWRLRWPPADHDALYVAAGHLRIQVRVSRTATAKEGTDAAHA